MPRSDADRQSYLFFLISPVYFISLRVGELGSRSITNSSPGLHGIEPICLTSVSPKPTTP